MNGARLGHAAAVLTMLVATAGCRGSHGVSQENDGGGGPDAAGGAAGAGGGAGTGAGGAAGGGDVLEPVGPEGGRVAEPSGTAVVIPPGALTETTMIGVGSVRSGA